MIKSQEGLIEVLIPYAMLGFVLLLFGSMFFIRFQGSQSDVSGIVYNTEFDHVVSGKTTFSIRAAADTYVSTENQSSFCLPKNSPYTSLIKKAAADKTIKVEVIANKYFAIQSPFTCQNNVIVKEVKS